jgi:hypothetical protein
VKTWELSRDREEIQIKPRRKGIRYLEKEESGIKESIKSMRSKID